MDSKNLIIITCISAILILTGKVWSYWLYIRYMCMIYICNRNTQHPHFHHGEHVLPRSEPLQTMNWSEYRLWTSVAAPRFRFPKFSEKIVFRLQRISILYQKTYGKIFFDLAPTFFSCWRHWIQGGRVAITTPALKLHTYHIPDSTNTTNTSLHNRYRTIPSYTTTF